MKNNIPIAAAVWQYIKYDTEVQKNNFTFLEVDAVVKRRRGGFPDNAEA